MEGDCCSGERCQQLSHFNPLPPHGGRQDTTPAVSTLMPFQSTPSAWRETPYIWMILLQLRNFNPLPPHGGRPLSEPWKIGRADFNPLPPHGGRRDRQFAGCTERHFNPLPPHGGRRTPRCRQADFATYFNPLPPHGGRRIPVRSRRGLHLSFQSTPSAWRETRKIS